MFAAAGVNALSEAIVPPMQKKREFNVKSATDYLLQLEREAPRAQHWDWEATLERSYRQLLPPGAIVIDVGAHTGRHVESLRNQVRCARIYAVEPQPHQASILRDRYGDSPEITLITAAMGAQSGAARFTVNSAAPEESGLRRRHYNDEAAAVTEEIDVEVSTVDQLAADAALTELHFIKIDVEGAEMDVLEGGRGTIQRLRPLLAVEYGSPGFSVYGRQPGDLFDLATSLNYVLMDLLGHPCTDRDAWLALVDAYYWDYLLVPAERSDWTRGQLSGLDWPVPAANASRPADMAASGGWWQQLRRRLRPDRSEASVAAAYRAVLGREPDPSGLAHYQSLLRAGRINTREIEAQLRASDEYAARQKNLSR